MGETVRIPYRIYFEVLSDDALVHESRARAMADCLYTRHHDGRVRQRFLTDVLANLTEWSVPFVVQLAGEYVIEIIEQILASSRTWNARERALVGAFLSENPPFFRQTRARVVSYWDCYYRDRWPSLTSYPGQDLVTELGLMRDEADRLRA